MSERRDRDEPLDIDPLLEAAWGIIANAFHGNWDEAPDDWRQAAERWRDGYHERLGIALMSVQRWADRKVLSILYRGPVSYEDLITECDDDMEMDTTEIDAALDRLDHWWAKDAGGLLVMHPAMRACIDAVGTFR